MSSGQRERRRRLDGRSDGADARSGPAVDRRCPLRRGRRHGCSPRPGTALCHLDDVVALVPLVQVRSLARAGADHRAKIPLPAAQVRTSGPVTTMRPVACRSMSDRIVVGFNGSPTSRRTIDRAAQEAAARRSALDIVTGVDQPWTGADAELLTASTPRRERHHRRRPRRGARTRHRLPPRPDRCVAWRNEARPSTSCEPSAEPPT